MYSFFTYIIYISFNSIFSKDILSQTRQGGLNMEKGSIGNAIKNARLKADITQEELAEKIGISVTHLKHIESEHRMPSVQLLIKIMTVLGMSFDDIVFDTHEDSKLLHNTINLLKQCPKRDLNIINDMLHAMRKYE